VFVTRPVDLTSMLVPGTGVTVGVHHAPSEQPTILQDLIEYALLAAFVSLP
jgi:hypothetical protein